MHYPLRLALALSLTSPLLSQTPRTWVVDPLGSGDETSINRAITLARDGDTIRCINCEEYFRRDEPENWLTIANKSLTIVGDPFIGYGGYRDPSLPGPILPAPVVRIRGSGSQHVELRNLRLVGRTTITNPSIPVVVHIAEMTRVSFVSCEFLIQGLGTGERERAPTTIISDSPVAFTDCRIDNYGTVLSQDTLFPGSPQYDSNPCVEAPSVHARDSEFLGGGQYDQSLFFFGSSISIPFGGLPAPAIVAEELYFARCSFQGGSGATITDDLTGRVLGKNPDAPPLDVDTVVNITSPEAAAFGDGCEGSEGIPALELAPASEAWIGGTVRISLSNLPLQLQSVPFVLMGFSNENSAGLNLPVDLWFVGMPGCDLLVNPDRVFTLTKNGTEAEFSKAIPDEWTLGGLEVFFQGLVLDPGVNPFGGITTSAVGVRIGLEQFD